MEEMTPAEVEIIDRAFSVIRTRWAIVRTKMEPENLPMYDRETKRDLKNLNSAKRKIAMALKEGRL